MVRMQPDPRHQLFREPDIPRQAQAMRALRASSRIPVPTVRGEEADAAVLGAPFMIMDAVEGRALDDVPTWHASGWATQLTLAERGQLYDNALGVLAELHTLRRSDGFAFLADAGGRGTTLERHLARIGHWYEWVLDGREFELLEHAWRSLRDQCPGNDTEVVLWGDARVGNMLFAEDLSVAAALDWELACLGPPEIDLGWWLVFERFLSHGQGAPRLAGLPDRDGTISRYESLTERAVGPMDYYEMLAEFVLAVVLVRSADLQFARGQISADSVKRTHSPGTRMLASRFGWEVPDLAPEYAALFGCATRPVG